MSFEPLLSVELFHNIRMSFISRPLDLEIHMNLMWSSWLIFSDFLRNASRILWAFAVVGDEVLNWGWFTLSLSVYSPNFLAFLGL